MKTAHGVNLQEDGADIFIFRTSRESSTKVLVYLEGEYLGGFVGNIDSDGTPDYVIGMRGPPDGHYLLKPKPPEDFENGPFEYVPGTPSITGSGRPIGSPAEGWKNTVRFHPCGGSTGCQTGPLEWANRIWDIVEDHQNSTNLRIKTEPLGSIPVGRKLPRPRSHPWPAFAGGSKKPIP
jgi:hypothetical protein